MKLSQLALVALLLAPVALDAQATPAPAERDSVMAAITDFLTGMRTRDSALMASRVDSLTRMTLLRPAPGGGVRVVAVGAAQFMRIALNPNQPPIDEPIRNAVVQVDGDLAQVWAEYQVRREGRVSHCGYDAFHLARLGGRWKILNVSDTYRTTGCGEMWR